MTLSYMAKRRSFRTIASSSWWRWNAVKSSYLATPQCEHTERAMLRVAISRSITSAASASTLFMSFPLPMYSQARGILCEPEPK
jgi:hypothetical protein